MKTNSARLLGFAAALAAPWIVRCDPIHYYASLAGSNENPVNASPGVGFAVVAYDSTAHTLQVDFNFSGLLGTTTASHIHAPSIAPANAGVATTTPTFAGTPLGVTAGVYANLLDLTQLSSFNPSYVTLNGGTAAGAEAALATALAANQAYLNIHTTSFPGGEIRGFLTVPETSTVFAGALLGGGILFQLVARKRK